MKTNIYYSCASLVGLTMMDDATTPISIPMANPVSSKNKLAIVLIIVPLSVNPRLNDLHQDQKNKIFLFYKLL
jgi:hypothetical protein